MLPAVRRGAARSGRSLDGFVVIGLHDEIGRRLLDRYASVVTDVEFLVAVHDDADRETLRALADVVQGADDTAARAAIASGGNADVP